MTAMTDDGDDNDSSVVVAFRQRAKEIPWEEATKYILLDTSYGMQPWLWRALRDLGWRWSGGKYIPPGVEQSSFNKF